MYCWSVSGTHPLSPLFLWLSNDLFFCHAQSESNWGVTFGRILLKHIRYLSLSLSRSLLEKRLEVFQQTFPTLSRYMGSTNRQEQVQRNQLRATACWSTWYWAHALLWFLIACCEHGFFFRVLYCQIVFPNIYHLHPWLMIPCALTRTLFVLWRMLAAVC